MQVVSETSDHVVPCDEVTIATLTLADENAAAVPTRILIAPWGHVRSSAGAFVVDDQSAAATLAAFTEHGTDLPVDYEHQTLGGPYSSPTGQAPAAGWIKALSAITPAQSAAAGLEPGLWAQVEWTPQALEKLRSREYRYLSPVALVRRADRRLVALHSVALTNKPAIAGMNPVVAREAALVTHRDTTVNPIELRERFNLSPDASHEVVLVAAVERIAALEQAHALREATDRVAQAMSAGKLTPAQKPWAMALAQRDPAEFDRWESSAPVIVPLGRTTAPSSALLTGGSAKPDVERLARAEWQANQALLANLCSEEAFVADALRESVGPASLSMASAKQFVGPVS